MKIKNESVGGTDERCGRERFSFWNKVNSQNRVQAQLRLGTVYNLRRNESVGERTNGAGGKVFVLE